MTKQTNEEGQRAPRQKQTDTERKQRKEEKRAITGDNKIGEKLNLENC